MFVADFHVFRREEGRELGSGTVRYKIILESTNPDLKHITLYVGKEEYARLPLGTRFVLRPVNDI